VLKVANNGGSSRACGGDHRHYRLLGVETRTVAKQAMRCAELAEVSLLCCGLFLFL